MPVKPSQYLTRYEWDPEFRLYRRSGYREFAYSDGIAVEQRILQIVSAAADRSTFSIELAEAITDWPSEYHLSRLRHNLIRSLGIRPDDTVLEFGCGCGAITRFLGEVGAQVTALEGSVLRARIAAERCADLPNVTVIADDLLQFEPGQSFDWVLMIGVLEYAPLFCNDPDPASVYLGKAHGFTGSEGKLVVAIENKLGLKYLNGCAEEHLGIPFAGVQGLYKDGGPITFGKHELSAKLRDAGYSQLSYYFPFPDYKLPNVVIHESALCDPEFDAADLLARSQARDYTGGQYRSFDEALVFTQLQSNQLLADLSNSFLIVCSSVKGTEDRALATAFSTNRIPPFSAQTTFARYADGIRVKKEPIFAGIERTKIGPTGLEFTNLVGEFPYHHGRQLQWRLLAARAEGADLERMVRELQPWFRFLLLSSSRDQQSFSPASCPADDLASLTISARFLDCTPFNIIETAGTFTLIDEEWAVDSQVALGWVVLRGVAHSTGAGPRTTPSNLSWYTIIHKLSEEAGFRVSEEAIAAWIRDEQQFQEFVTGYRSQSASHELCSSSHALSAAGDLVHKIEERDAQINNLSTRVSQLGSDRNRLLMEREDIGQDIVHLHAQLSATNQEADFYRTEHSKALASASWKLTAPLRRATAAVRQAKDRLLIFRGKPPANTPPSASTDHSPSQLVTAPANPKHDSERLSCPPTPPYSVPLGKIPWNYYGKSALAEFLNSSRSFELPQYSHPLISVIVVLYNKAHLSLLAIESIIRNADLPYELILVDNASSDDTQALTQRIVGATVFRNETNLGFGEACVRAVSQARGNYICFLNNDALLLPGSFTAAFEDFKDPTVGAVGGKILLADGSLQEAGSILWSDGTASGYGRGGIATSPSYNFRRPVDFCSGSFLITPRHLFLRFGGFSPLFFPAYYEDLDYCMQLWADGFSVLYEPRAAIRHYESASSDAPDSARALMKLQQSKFMSKWRDLLGTHLPRLAENIPSARFARHVHKGHILYIDDRVPHRNLGSGYPRSCEILQCLIDMGYAVTVATFLFNLGESEYTDIPRDIELIDGVAERERVFREYVPYADIIWISRPHNYASFIDASVQLWARQGKASLIYDAEAIAAERDQLQTHVEGQPVPDSILEARVRRELALAGAADAVVAVSSRDAGLMRAAGLSNVHVLGHCIEVEPTPASFEERSSFAFIGAMHGPHNPNADAVRYFCREVWPFVRARTGAEFVIAGYGTNEILNDLRGDGIRIVGPVNDVSTFYNAARVIIIPTRYSGGIPLKAYEAAAYGVPLVVSPLIREQLGWSGQKECRVADSPTAYAKACSALYTDPISWQALRDAALHRVRSDLSRTRFREQIADVVRSVCQPCHAGLQ